MCQKPFTVLSAGLLVFSGARDWIPALAGMTEMTIFMPFSVLRPPLCFSFLLTPDS